jgi:hypothetical protein
MRRPFFSEFGLLWRSRYDRLFCKGSRTRRRAAKTTTEVRIRAGRGWGEDYSPRKKISVLPTKSVWQGIIEPGSIPVEFSLEIEGDRVTGIAERKGADGGFLKAKFDGTFDGKTLHFEETDIIANKAVKIRWITIKGKMELVLAPKMAFDGTWVGTENPKLAGRVYLEKK